MADITAALRSICCCFFPHQIFTQSAKLGDCKPQIVPTTFDFRFEFEETLIHAEINRISIHIKDYVYFQESLLFIHKKCVRMQVYIRANIYWIY